jgi:isopentenyl-diphosphate delta-isomerase
MSAESNGSQRGTIGRRKAEHLALCASGEVDFRGRTAMFEDVELFHDALPERTLSEVCLEVDLFGKRLKAPLFIAAMTGGTDEAERINHDLARVAEALGIGFGLGSQRAMIVRPETFRTFEVRKVAPTALVLGNIGVVQAKQMPTSAVEELVGAVGADALCVHLNPAMELVQQDGDRDFRGASDAIERLVRELSIPVVVKETGCGISRRVARRLRDLGVRNVDVSGAGGTSWVAVETKRAETSRNRQLGETLWDWGIPTAASVAMLTGLGLQVIATGGVRNGLDVAKALALGAAAAGLAAPVLRAHRAGGHDAAVEFLSGVIDELRAVTLITGCASVSELRIAPRVLSPRLHDWVDVARRSDPTALADKPDERPRGRNGIHAWRGL